MFEYCNIPEQITDIDVFLKGAPQNSWLNLGAEISKKVERGCDESGPAVPIYIVDGPYANAGLKHTKIQTLDNGYMIYKHCRSDARVAIRRIGLVAIATRFVPASKTSGVVEAGVQYSYALAGTDIGFIRVGRDCTVAGLHSLIISEMRRNGQISHQCNIKLVAFEYAGDGNVVTRHTRLRNCKVVCDELNAHPDRVGKIEAFLAEPMKKKSSYKNEKKTNSGNNVVGKKIAKKAITKGQRKG